MHVNTILCQIKLIVLYSCGSELYSMPIKQSKHSEALNNSHTHIYIYTHTQCSSLHYLLQRVKFQCHTHTQNGQKEIENILRLDLRCIKFFGTTRRV